MTQASLKEKYEYRRRVPHYQKDDGTLFVTFCVGSYDPLPESVRDIVLRHCLHDHGTKARVHAAVVMPDHVQLLLTPLRDAGGNPYSLVEILQAIIRSIRPQCESSSSPIGAGVAGGVV